MDHLTPDPDLYNVPWAVEAFNSMPWRLLGRSGLRVSSVGLGTWKFGYPETGDDSRVAEKEAMAILDRAVELGVTHWDTANRYNNASGNSERILGKWLKANPDQRRNLTLATKIFGGMDGRSPNHCRLSRLNVIESTYASMERLQIDAIDVMYFHAYDPHTPITESLEAIEDLMRQDLVRYLAVSNFGVEQLEAYEAAAGSLSGRVRVHAVQNGYDILSGERPAMAGTLDYCARTGISFVAFSPLARGLLTNRYLDPRRAASGDRLFDEGTLQADLGPETLERLRALAAIAADSELTVSQLVLAYMLATPGMGPVIPAASTIAQLEENARAGTVEMEKQQIERVRRAVGNEQ